jgi:hypothetical protein
MALFTDRSIWTMLHGIALGGGAMMTLFGALVLVFAFRPGRTWGDLAGPARALGALSVASAALLWLTVLAGTYIVFPPYRATPPEGTTILTDFPRSLIQSDPSTAWLHSFAMESKEHIPWIAAILATAMAFVVTRYRGQLWNDARVRNATMAGLAICLALVAYIALLGVFVNKVAPLQ